MLIVCLNIQSEEQYLLNTQITEALRELVGASCITIFLKPDYLSTNIMDLGSYVHFGNFPTLILTIPDTYHDEPEEFLKRLRAELSPQEELQLAGVYSKLHMEESEEGEPYMFTTIEMVFLT